MNEIAKQYDLVIIGAGPAGLTASIYASRYGINHLVIGNKIGGEVFGWHEIGNFPSYDLIKGVDLAEKMKTQVEKLGATILNDTVENIEKDPSMQLRTGFKIQTLSNGTIEAKTVLLALGTREKKLGIEGEDQFVGKGVSYCVHCDGAFFKDKKVAVVGGGDSAITAALYLTDIAKQVYVINRSDKLKAEKIWQRKLKEKNNVEFLLETNIVKMTGVNVLNKIILNNGNEIEIDGVFIEIGSMPDLSSVDKMNLETDKKGCIKISKDGATNVEGIWAAGDTTDGSNNFRQVITACAEGAITAKSIHSNLSVR